MSGTRKRAAGVALIAALALSACGSGSNDRETASGVTVDVAGVTVTGFAYEPDVLTVAAGTTVEWTNDDRILHTVTSGEPGESGVPGVSEDVAPAADGTFDLELDGAGTTARFTFDESGSFTYFCAIHAGMTGRVDVSSS